MLEGVGGMRYLDALAFERILPLGHTCCERRFELSLEACAPASLLLVLRLQLLIPSLNLQLGVHCHALLDLGPPIVECGTEDGRAQPTRRSVYELVSFATGLAVHSPCHPPSAHVIVHHASESLP